MLLALLSPDGSWQGPLPVLIFYFGIMNLAELYHGIIVPNYQAEKGIRRRVPDLIYIVMAILIILITLPSGFMESDWKVDYRFLSNVSGIIYLTFKVGHLWVLKQSIVGREHLAEE